MQSKKFQLVKMDTSCPESGLKLVDKSSPSFFISQFDPTPPPAIQQKVNYFFKPYCPNFERSKHMVFDDQTNL